MSRNVKNLTIYQSEVDDLIRAEVEKLNGELLPTDWTVKRVMSEYGLTEDQARGMLRRLVDKGVLYAVRVRNPGLGPPVNAYRKK